MIWNFLALSSKLHFIARALLCDWASSRQVRILCSESGWNGEMMRTLKYTKHRVTFGEIRAFKGEAFDIVVPLSIEDTLFLADNRGAFPNNRFPVTERKVVELLDDKTAFNDFLIKEGFHEWIPAVGVDTPPFILKRKTGAYGNGCHYVDTDTALKKFGDELGSADYFTQSMVPGRHEYATHVLVKDGRILDHLCIEYSFDHEFPIKGQDPARCIRIVRERHLEKWQRLLSLIGYSGLCCVNYKYKDGVPLLFEINPRFGGSLAIFFFAFLKRLGDGELRPAMRPVLATGRAAQAARSG